MRYSIFKRSLSLFLGLCLAASVAAPVFAAEAAASAAASPSADTTISSAADSSASSEAASDSAASLPVSTATAVPDASSASSAADSVPADSSSVSSSESTLPPDTAAVEITVPHTGEARWQDELAQRNSLSYSDTCAKSRFYSAALSDLNWPELQTRLHNAALNLQTTVRVDDLDISLNSFLPYYSILYGNLQCMSGGYAIRDIRLYGSATLSYFEIIYYSAGEIAAMQAEIASIKSAVPAGATALETAVIVHDRLISQTGYSTERYRSNTLTDEDHCSYNVLLTHTGVCDGYAKTYACIMNELGIHTIEVTSYQLSHAWNMIYIDNAWYQVDCTFDDSVSAYTVGGMSDSLGECSHTYFLLSTSAMQSHSEHYATDFSAVDTTLSNIVSSSANSTYDSAWWHSVYSPLYYYGNDWYYARGSAIRWRDTLLSSSDALLTGAINGSSYAALAMIGNRVFLTAKSASQLSSSIEEYQLDTAAHALSFVYRYSRSCYGIVGYSDILYYASACGKYQQTVSQLASLATAPGTDFSIEGFVTRLYKVCLSREPDSDGLTAWSNSLRNGMTGTQVAYNFVFSAEFTGKNYCNSCYVKQLYQAFLGRGYDDSGLANWVAQLNAGATREAVFNGFAGSAEFASICKQYGIVVGSAIAVPQYGTMQAGTCSGCGAPDGVTSFVTRLYKTCLDRNPDDAGLANWCGILRNHLQTGTGVAASFIFSAEFTSKNYCNSCYVKHLYEALLGRTYDDGGLASWVAQLNAGATREAVFNGFAGSAEFAGICSQYGISIGSGIAVPQYGTVAKGSCSSCGAQDGVTGFVTRLYQTCLDRTPDAGGLNSWSSQLWAHSATGTSVAYGFIFSYEFTSKNYSDEEYVRHLYRAFLGREADPSGLANWVSQLQHGSSRAVVFNGFAGSAEFGGLCRQYGITQ